VQGSPISGLLFNLAQADAMKRVRSQNPDNVIVSLHDDHFIVGPPEDALAAAKDVADQMNEIGLQINLAKSKIYSPTPLPRESTRKAHLYRTLSLWNSRSRCPNWDAWVYELVLSQQSR
jgi:hypothetical protein